ncbi:MAG: hypothetical protein JXO49_09790 [Deltaproteobacteria bacterium]|nr:hypothetical protein [Candidatus Anaeroferrophillus wilburensis]MBN2889623.1 hypothetical protein [Deltaproteobacteria bacterium]
MKKHLLIALTFALLIVFPTTAPAFDVGPFSIGGAMRANYTVGDYGPELDNRPSRAEEDGGSVNLDTFRINIGYEQGSWIGKLEYRFYPGYGTNNHDSYHFLHTGWIGYNFADQSQIQVGVNRVPFGPGAWGISQSWMFDQHYYVGLADDMDFGVKYSKPLGNLKLDFAYYFSDEGSYYGENFSRDSVRYSYDVVDETGDGYQERHQFNVRAIYTMKSGDVSTDLGASLQYGQLESNGPQDDGEHYAASVHAVTTWGNWKLAPQLTYYKYDVDDDQPLGTDKLVQFGAFDFPTLVAAEAWIPAVSLSYTLKTPQLEWLDYVVPYVEYSAIVKEENSFNDSEMIVLGAAFASGGWYIYADLAYSNGNDFVGNEVGYGSPSFAPVWTSNRFGANPTNEWEYRFNINFGYYF